MIYIGNRIYLYRFIGVFRWNYFSFNVINNTGYVETDRMARVNFPRYFMNLSIYKSCVQIFLLLFWNGADFRFCPF